MIEGRVGALQVEGMFATPEWIARRETAQQGKIGVRYGTEKSTPESRNIKAQPAIQMSW